MAEAKKEGREDRKRKPGEYEVCRDPIDLMHFLPPRRCGTCED